MFLQDQNKLVGKLRTAQLVQDHASVVPLGKKLRALREAELFMEHGLFCKAANTLIAADMKPDAEKIAAAIKDDDPPYRLYDRAYIYERIGRDITNLTDDLTHKGAEAFFYAALLLSETNQRESLKRVDILSKRPRKKAIFGVISPTEATPYSETFVHAGTAPGETITFSRDRSPDENAAEIMRQITFIQTDPMERVYNAFRIYLKIGFDEGVRWCVATLCAHSDHEWYNQANVLIDLGGTDPQRIDRFISQTAINFPKLEDRYSEYTKITTEDAVVAHLPEVLYMRLLTEQEKIRLQLAQIQINKLFLIHSLFGHQNSVAIRKAEALLKKVDFSYLSRNPDRSSKWDAEAKYQCICADIAFENPNPEAQRYAGEIYAKTQETQEKAKNCADQLYTSGMIDQANLVYRALFLNLGRTAQKDLAREIEPKLPVLALEEYQVVDREAFLRLAEKIIRTSTSFDELKRTAHMISAQDKRTDLMNQALTRLREFGEDGSTLVQCIMREYG